MTYNVKDWREKNQRRRYKPAIGEADYSAFQPRERSTPNEDLVAFRLALRDAAHQARAEFPTEFCRADKILAEPRNARSVAERGKNMNYDIDSVTRECPWCGDDFIPGKTTQTCCSLSCGHFYSNWLKRRNALV